MSAEPQLLTLRELAQVLGVEYGSLHHDVYHRGLRPAVRGRRGPKGAALFNVDEVRAWRANRLATLGPADPVERITRRAARIPDLIAAAAYTVYMQAPPLDKQAIAGALAKVAYEAAEQIDDELRDVLPNLPALGSELPHQICRLREVSRQK